MNPIVIDPKLSQMLPAPELLILFDPTLSFVEEMTAQFPNYLVFVFSTGAVEDIENYTEIVGRNPYVMRPMYLGNISPTNRARAARWYIAQCLGGPVIETTTTTPTTLSFKPPPGPTKS